MASKDLEQVKRELLSALDQETKRQKDWIEASPNIESLRNLKPQWPKLLEE